jgi:hypothetical protein
MRFDRKNPEPRSAAGVPCGFDDEDMSMSQRWRERTWKRRGPLVGFGLLLGSGFSLVSAAQKLPDPIIVTIKEQETSELDGLANLLIGSLGVAGVLILASILAAVIFAGLLFWFRSRAD